VVVVWGGGVIVHDLGYRALNSSTGCSMSDEKQEMKREIHKEGEES
jgi:hypothetical protein